MESAGGEPLGSLELRCEQAGREWLIRVVVGRNDDPAALGCHEDARGLPWCRATVEPAARGYNDALGWIQLVTDTASPHGREPKVDPFEPLGEIAHPFCFYGFSPTHFDAPHRDERHDTSWRAHAFLAGIGGAFEAFPLLGFSWGFEIRAGEIAIPAPEPLTEATWTADLPSLRRDHPRWSFRESFGPRRSLALLDYWPTPRSQA